MSSEESSVALTQQNKYNEHTIGTTKLSHSRSRKEVAAYILILTGGIIYMYFCNLTRRGNRSFLGIVGTSAGKNNKYKQPSFNQY